MSPPASDAYDQKLKSLDEASASGKDSANMSDCAQQSLSPPPLRISTTRSSSDIPAAASMNPSSTPLGTLNAARRPGPAPVRASVGGGGLPQDMQAKMKAFHLSRQGAPPGQTARAPVGVPQPGTTGPIPNGAIGGGLKMGGPVAPGPMSGPIAGGPAAFRLPQNARPQFPNVSSAPVIPNVSSLNPRMGLAAKRGLNRGMKLADAMGPTPPANQDAASKTTVGILGSTGGEGDKSKMPETAFSKYSEFVDTAKGTLNFKGKATIHGAGIDFSSGTSFNISLDEVDTLEELGKGNYGTVYQVRHSRPRMRRPGLGLKGNVAPSLSTTSSSSSSVASPTTPLLPDSPETLARGNTGGQGKTTGLVMAMKEIRLELDEAKFAAIIMELDILHRCVSPFIIDFYGAFFQEGAVYICMEFMDGGSIDKLYGDGIPEAVLRKITLSTVMGLKSLKDEHNIIHRDVKPTNILVNSKGQVKICDFGVSGNLVASIAKTNIGCQSYMAPERIASGGVAQAGANPGGGTYSVQSDIWSLGLSIIECAMGRYPYPPETYNNIFSQLSAIVDGDPPDLPSTGFSDAARDFVRSCLHKIPKQRPTYAMLIRHQWLAPLLKPPTISEEDEEEEEEEEEEEAEAESDEIGADSENSSAARGVDTSDKEVAAWVVGAMERRRLGKMGKSEKPALHAVSLDRVGSPEKEFVVAAGGD